MHNYYIYIGGFVEFINGSVKTVSYTNSEIVDVYETQVCNITSANVNGIANIGSMGGTSMAHRDKISIYVSNV